MPGADAEVDVLIVGAGPVGLTARALLARWGVRSLLVDKREGLSPFPRSRLVNVRTMEIFRRLGLADTVAQRAFAPEYGRVRFRDTLREADFASAAMIGVNQSIPDSPVIGAVTSQDRLEPVLLGAADGPVRFGVELVSLSEGADGVAASLVDRASGSESRVRARYLLAADGANSTVRQLLGIGTTGPGALGRSTTVVFDADFDGWSAGQPAGVYFTARGSFLPLYPEGGWAWIAPTPEETANVDWAALVASALGPGDDLGVKVLRVEHWVVNAFVAENLRHGRVQLAGDAAHAIPPAGGMGMNAGVADVHNLCWKLAGALHGWAGPGLLETYEPERLPVAHQTLRQAVSNAQLMKQAQERRQEQQRATGEARAAEVELPWSEKYFAQLGFVLGVAYRSAAVLTDHITPAEPSEPGTDYVPTVQPGHRMPHFWLTPDRSTLDAVGEWFTLFTPDPVAWSERNAGPWPLRVEKLTTEYAELCDLRPNGALLVRPDGHIAARWPERPTGDSTLHSALAAINQLAAGS